jgi:regulator of sigma E protease
MLDEREGEVAQSEQHRAFNRQTVATRFAIVAAGPVFNFIFAALAYWLMLTLGVSGLKPVIGEISPESVMARAGFEVNDEIVSINGQSTPIWDIAIQELVISALNREAAEVVISKGDSLTESKYIDFQSVGKYEEPDEALKAIGLKPWRPDIAAVVGKIIKDSPAEKAGLKIKDKIVAVGGTTINNWYDLVNKVSTKPDEVLDFAIDRDGKQINLKIRPRLIESNGKKVGQIGIGPMDTVKIPDDMQRIYQYPLITGLMQAGDKVWRNSVLTLKMIGKLLTGQVSLKNLSGPINIAVYAGYSASAGLPRFLDFLAIISISLGVINLLPIPLLDGGHLMYYLVEIIKGQPVSERFEMLGQRIGISIIILMMALAIGNDLSRLFGG